MKKLFLIAVVLMVSLFSINIAKAQVNVNVNINSQPLWGPTGYNHVDYYYFPDVNAYYYVPTRQYIYQNGNRWVWANNLPSKYQNFDLYNAYKVVINKPHPYLQNNLYAAQYVRYKNYSGKQSVIRDSHDTKYYAVKSHSDDRKITVKQVNVHQPNNVRPNRNQKFVTKRTETIKVHPNNERSGGGYNRLESGNGQRGNAHH